MNIQLLDNIKLKPEKLITLFGIFYFLISQPWDMASTTDGAIVLWLVGMFYAIKDRGLSALSRSQRIICFFSILTFYTSYISWLGTPYELYNGNLEPPFRFIMLPFIILAVVKSKITAQEIILALVASGFSYAISAYYESQYLGIIRVDGDENAVTFGNGAILIFSCLIFSLMIPMHWLSKIIITGAAVSAFYASVLSGTRSSMLVLIPILILITWLYGKKSLNILGLGLTGLILFSLSSNFISENFESSTKSIEDYLYHQDTQTSVGQRFLLWKASICVYERYPWWGIGPKVFKNIMIDENNPCYIKVITNKKYFTHAHSIYFQSLAERGTIGSIVLFSFFAIIIVFTLKKKLVLNNMTLIALIAMLTYGISMDIFYTRFIIDKHITLLGILIGISYIRNRHQSKLISKETIL